MTLHINTGGLWKEASVLVRVSGAWKEAEAYVRQGGLWYQASTNGLKLIIDSATTLYDFNLKNYLQGAGLWPASGPVVISELTITARTRISTTPSAIDVPSSYSTVGAGTPCPITFAGFRHKSFNTPTTLGWLTRHVFSQDLTRHAFTTGAGWPSGSLIRRFIVDGLIYGQGGSAPKAGNYPQVEGGAYIDFMGNALRPTGAAVNPNYEGHGYNALEVTIPVGELLGFGGVYGGGAAANWYRAVQQAGSGNLLSLSTLPSKNTPLSYIDIMERIVQAPTTDNSMSYTPASFISEFLPNPNVLIFPYLHGLGGGQGGGKGGRVNHPTVGTANDTTVAIQAYAQAGGDGSIAAAGGTATATTRYTSIGKYGNFIRGARVLSPALAGSWGQDATAGHLAHPDDANLQGRTTDGMVEVSTNPKVDAPVALPYNNKGGAAVTGVSFITSRPNPNLFKGVLK